MITIFKLIYKNLNKKLKKSLFILIFLSILIPVLEMAGVAIIIPIIQISLNSFEMPNSISTNIIENFFKEQPSQEMVTFFLVLIIFLFFIFKSIFLILSEKFKLRYFKMIQDNFSIKLYNNYIYSNYEEFSKYQFSEKYRNIGNIGALTDYLKNINEIVVAIFFFIFIFIFLLIYNFKVSLFIFFLFFVISTIIYLFSRSELLKYSKIKHKQSAKIVGNLLNVFYSIKEVIILKRRLIFQEKFSESFMQMTKSAYKDGLIKFIPRIILELLLITIILSILIFLIYKKQSIENNLELIGVFTFAMLKISLSANKILLAFQNLKSLKFPAEEISNELSSLFDKENENIINEDHSSTKINFSDRINLKNVYFKYLTNNENTLENINLEIKKNSIIGIFGPSGGGKTTLINLILGFLKPSSGQICVDDFDTSKNIPSWQNSLAYVPQDIFLFNDTIKNNILFGLNENDITENDIKKITKLVNLDEFLNRTENGLNTVVGEKATRLSGGQAQRISIARSILRGSEIIVLDEATSKLDENNEYEILESITKKLSNSKTFIIISHRFNTLKKFCDKVFELSNNKLVLKYQKN